jgi:hypothetical protein
MSNTKTNYAAELDKAITEHVRDTPEFENGYLDLWLGFIGNDPEGCSAYLKELDEEASR